MSSASACGAGSTILHLAVGRPLIGALVCLGLGGSAAYTMKGSAISDCVNAGGHPYVVTEVLQKDRVCAERKVKPAS